MNCRFCGTALPDAAQFCGECGRPAPVAQAPARTRPAMPAIVFSSEPEGERSAGSIAVAESEYSCPQCGEPISDDDVFCGECGFVLTSSYLSAPVDALGDLHDSVERSDSVEAEPDDIPDPGEPADIPEQAETEWDAGVTDTGEITGVSGWVAVASDPASAIELVADPEPEVSVAHEPEPVIEHEPAPVEPAFLEPEVIVEHHPAPVAAPPAKILRGVPDPFPWGKDPRVPTIDLEATRISAAPLAEERFVLQFSTGESVTVSGAGLVGRNPASQPGEFVDQLVTIFDAGKSVSKTHLEFGQDSGRFWVSDRYSTNGSTVRQPDAEPKRCEPGRRYFVARGTRVDIGDQFFVVS
ncbi:zinc-ribbon domain-containing protein [Pseudolysinimonas sp.]|jgi:hypothetical protein|uniref:zinc-ribbon domain-containing protein n=1 Tax=Pseudolysinimonas sp. TaxID=2680009 RepID=UPI003784EBFC